MKLEWTGKRRWGRKVYKVVEGYDFYYTSAYIALEVNVPQGFETDLASIPWPLHHVLPADGPWKYAAVVHDRLCESNCNRFLTDAVFRHKMEEDGVKLRSVLFYGVRFYWTFIGMPLSWMRKKISYRT